MSMQADGLGAIMAGKIPGALPNVVHGHRTAETDGRSGLVFCAPPCPLDGRTGIRPHILSPGWPGPSLSVRARPTSAPAPGGLSIFGRAKMNRFVVMVDADSLFRQAIDIVSTRAPPPRADLDIVAPAALIEALLDKSRSTLDLTRKELLRVYWYDGVMANGFTPQQRSLAHIDDVQFRAGTINGRDQQKDIASLIATDLLELACHQAICDAVLVTGDSDLAVGIDMAKKRGVRIAVLGVE